MDVTTLTTADVIRVCATNNDLFARTFFPTTMRQVSPPAHREVWDVLENPHAKLVNLRMARGFAKTTLSRIYTAKRIAYGMTHTALYVGASEPHAIRSITWIKNRIARPDPASGKLILTPFAKTFGLRVGRKWSENEIEVYHGLDERPIWLLGVGVTGNIRGINFDDYRPDLIYCDDILTDENAATEEQRRKIINLVFGALRQSLAPEVDEPNAKMVISQTPLHKKDISALASEDPEFTTVEAPCWTKETVDLPVEQQVSAWEERMPTEDLREEKKTAIRLNRYSIFAREKEVRLVTKEQADFRSEWLKVREAAPPRMYCILVIDPVPPPSELQLQKNLKGKDFECQMVVGRHKGEYHILDYRTNRGHEPTWSIKTAFELSHTWGVSGIVVEAIAYQRVLKSLLEAEMVRRRTYYRIDTYEGRGESKYARITREYAGVASQGRLWIGSGMSEFMLQFETYPDVDHDDVLDAGSMGLAKLVNPYLEEGTAGNEFDEEDGEDDGFELRRMCP